jgi:hypothetical protein
LKEEHFVDLLPPLEEGGSNWERIERIVWRRAAMRAVSPSQQLGKN